MAKSNWKRLGRRLRTDEDPYEDEIMGFGNDSFDLPGRPERARGGRGWVHRPTWLAPVGDTAPQDRCAP
jgi:hypothetical protein